MSCRSCTLGISTHLAMPMKAPKHIPKNSVVSSSLSSVEKHELRGDADEFLDDGGGVGRFDSGL